MSVLHGAAVCLPIAFAPGSALAQALLWEPVQPPPPLPASPLGARSVETTGQLSWELVPSASGPLAAPRAPAGSRETVVWEPVPPQDVLQPSPTRVAAEGSTPPVPEVDESLPEPPTYQTPRVRGLARGITVNGRPYTDTSFLVPNGYTIDTQFTASLILDFVNRTRSCRVEGDRDWVDCADVTANFEVTPFKGEDASLGFLWTVQSLTNRNEGTSTLEGQSLGFRAALSLGPTTGIAIGGEHVVQFDTNTDLGRNYYAVLSQALPLTSGPEPMLLVGTIGVGSNLYGYGNSDGTLGANDCLPGYECPWGGIGSVSLHLNSRLGFLWEYSGFSIAAGISGRPFRDLPLTLSFLATDFLGNTPDYITDFCTDDPCPTRYLGKFTLSW